MTFIITHSKRWVKKHCRYIYDKMTRQEWYEHHSSAARLYLNEHFEGTTGKIFRVRRVCPKYTVYPYDIGLWFIPEWLVAFKFTLPMF